MSSESLDSPDATYLRGLRDGVLTYQTCARGHAVFPPRLACPRCHDAALTWGPSDGRATIYSATTITPRDRDPYTVVLLDVDEGFRMMSRIDGPEALTAAIGDRVAIAVRPLPDGTDPVPCVDRVTTDEVTA
jgi:hypothetical protein